MVPGLADLDETAIQVVVDFDCGGVVTVFPEPCRPLHGAGGSHGAGRSDLVSCINAYLPTG